MTSLSVHKRLLPAVYLLLISLQYYSPCRSQVIVNRDNPNERIFLVRTKQFNEFADRFNNKTNFKGDPVDSAFMAKIPRHKMINSLFDLRDPRIDPNGKKFSEKYVTAKTEFINEVVHKNLVINKYSEKIIAEAKSRVIYKGITYTISIFLNQEIVGKDMVKWVINNVKGDLLNFLKPDTAYVRFIPPSSNETDFLNLKRALEDLDYLQYYASKEYTPDYLTLFFYMLNSGIVKFDYVESVNYLITDIPGWTIKVKDFNRNEMNSGWLIYDIEKISLK